MRMPSQTPCVLLAVVVLMSCSRTSETSTAVSSDARSGIAAGNAGVTRWAAAGEADSLADIYTTDAWAYPTGMAPLHGREAIRTFWKQVMAGGSVSFKGTTDDVDAVGDRALERGKWAIEFTRSPNAPAGSLNSFKDHGNYLTYWVKDGDRWRIKWDAGVSEVPPPATK